ERVAAAARFTHGDELRRHRHAGAHLLQAFHHDDVVHLQAFTHHAQAIDERPELYGRVFDLVVRTDAQHELHALIGADRAVIDEQGVILAASDQLDASEHAWRETAV